MAKLPLLSGRKVVKALSKIGFEQVGRKGSHLRLKRKGSEPSIVIVPMKKEIPRGTLTFILEQAKITREKFKKLL